jgi:hypothetical protein
MKKASIVASAFAATLGIESAYADDFAGAFAGLKAGGARSQAEGNYSTDRKVGGTGGVELGYDWNVYRAIVGVSTFADFNSRTNHTEAGKPTKFGSNVFGAALLLGAPINNEWLVYAKVGAGHLRGTGDASAVSATGLYYALGVSYEFAPRWAVGAEVYDSSGKRSGTKIDNDSMALTINYHFGGIGH